MTTQPTHTPTPWEYATFIENLLKTSRAMIELLGEDTRWQDNQVYIDWCQALARADGK